MAAHGTRQSYADGCRCPDCKLAQANYRRELKARGAGANVTEIRKRGRPRKDGSGPKPYSLSGALQTAKTSVGGEEVGPAEKAVLEELSTLTSAETRKGAAAAALAMARILDLPPGSAQQTQAAARVAEILDDLRKGSARRKGRLASVQTLVRPAGDRSSTGT